MSSGETTGGATLFVNRAAIFEFREKSPEAIASGLDGLNPCRAC
jgi:hypothetical protein